MAYLGMDFDPATVEPDVPMEPVPTGKYPVWIVETEVKNNKSNTGTLLSYKADIIDGQYKGRKIFGNLNLTHQIADAQRIGLAQLSSLCRAAGVGRIQDSNALHHRPFAVSVEYVPERTDNGKTYKPSNDVKSFMHINELNATPASAQPAPAKTAAPPPAPAPAPAQAPAPSAPPVYNHNPAPQAAPPVYTPPAAPAAAPAPWAQ